MRAKFFLIVTAVFCFSFVSAGEEGDNAPVVTGGFSSSQYQVYPSGDATIPSIGFGSGTNIGYTTDGIHAADPAMFNTPISVAGRLLNMSPEQLGKTLAGLAPEGFSGADLANALGLGSKQQAIDTLKSMPHEQAKEMLDLVKAVITATGSKDVLADYQILLAASKNLGVTLASVLDKAISESEFSDLLAKLTPEKLADLLESLDTEALAAFLKKLGIVQLTKILEQLSDPALATLIAAADDAVRIVVDATGDPYRVDKAVIAGQAYLVGPAQNDGPGNTLYLPLPGGNGNVFNNDGNRITFITDSGATANFSGTLITDTGFGDGSYSFKGNLNTGAVSGASMQGHAGSSFMYNANGGSGKVDGSGFSVSGFSGSYYDPAFPDPIFAPIHSSTNMQSNNGTSSYEVFESNASTPGIIDWGTLQPK